MPRALTGPQLATYAQQQIAAAERILAGHRDGGLVCSCGRSHPCSAAESVRSRCRFFAEMVAAMADHTIELPVIPATQGLGRRSGRVRHRRRINPWRKR